MNDTNTSQDLLLTKGSTQYDRGLSALSSSHFSVEERDVKFWLEYLRKFSKHIRFINRQQGYQGEDWAVALADEEIISRIMNYLAGLSSDKDIVKQISRPDFVLLLAFLKIVEYPLQQFHDLTERHKQHYYRTVLGMKEQKPVTDKCHLLIQLEDGEKGIILLKGERFSAGKDSQDQDLEYELLENTFINQASIGHVMSLTRFTIPDNYENELIKSNFLLTQLIHEENGLLLPEEGSLSFGESTLTNEKRQSYPLLGFNISSPLLWLQEGVRAIELVFDESFVTDLNQQSMPANATSRLLHWFDISITTAEGLIQLQNEHAHVSLMPVKDNAGNEKGIKIILQSLFSSISPLNQSLENEPSALPGLQFTMKQDTESLNNYDKLRKLAIRDCQLSVSVEGLRSLRLSNDQTDIDATKPFEPFTNEPFIKTRLLFSHPELVIKQIKNLQINFDWVDKPENLKDYYKTYSYYHCMTSDNSDDYCISGCPANDPCISIDPITQKKTVNEQACLTCLKSDCDCFLWPEYRVDWISSEQSDSSSTSAARNLFTANRAIEIHADEAEKFTMWDYKDLPHDDSNPLNWPAWYGFELQNNDFGHKDFSKVAEYFAFINASELAQLPAADFQAIQVPEPYTPVLNSLKINYHSSENVVVENAGKDQMHQMQLIHPLGKQFLVDSRYQAPYPIVPALTQNGYLYLGIKNMPIPGVVNIYFQLDATDNSNTSTETNISWRYLENNRWLKFLVGKQDPEGKLGVIVSDSTNELLDSGIISFQLAKTVTHEDGFPGNNMVWLRASINDVINEGGPRYSKISGIFTQGIKVEFIDQDNAADHLQTPLPAETIQSTVANIKEIAAVVQPFPSFGGKPKETATAFAVRASEQLRHKGRALTCWDYEHLVLAKFPELYLVKCVRNKGNTENPFQVSLIVVPQTHDPDILQPKVPLFLKKRIETYISNVTPAAAYIRVNDPVYESVYFDIRISIYTGFDTGMVAQKLNHDLIQFLTPWNKTLTGGGNIFDYEISIICITAFLEQQNYVDQVFSVKAYNILVDGVRHYYQANKIKASSDDAIVVPAVNHEIKVFTDDGAIFQGIGVMEIEFDYIVG